MTRVTRSRVSGETSFRPFMTRETVAIETPARSAICLIVKRFGTACVITSLKHVPERSGTERTGFGRNLRIFGLDFANEAVVTVPVTLSDNLLQTAQQPRWARKDRRCEAA